MRKIKALILSTEDLKEEFKTHDFKFINNMSLFKEEIVTDSVSVDVVVYHDNYYGDKVILLRW